MEISKPGLVETCGALMVTGRQKAPETLKVALALLAAKRRPHKSRMSLAQSIMALEADIIAVQ